MRTVTTSITKEVESRMSHDYTERYKDSNEVFAHLVIGDG